jgi:predicted nucleotidyltransferase
VSPGTRVRPCIFGHFVHICADCSLLASDRVKLTPTVMAPDLQLARDFAQALHAELGDNLIRMSLFGSRARRDHNHRSDYDFMIVLEQATGHARTIIHSKALAWELERIIDVSTKILSHRDFSRLSASAEGFWRNFQRDEQILWPTT